MREHLFTFQDGELRYSFLIDPKGYQKLPKKKRADYLSSLRDGLMECFPNVRKASRAHFCRFGASVLDFATKGVLEDVSAGLGFEIPSGFD